MNAVVELTEVSKRYTGADRPALSGVDLTIGDGEFTAIMGPSGSGKSTLLNLIAGLDKPESGSIVVAGAAVGAMSESEAARFRRDRLGVIFQFFHLLPTLSVSDNILVPAQLAGMKSATAERRCRDLLDRLGLSDKAQAYPAKLSGGQQQRVAIARALINEPRLLLADEPTGALDSASGEQVMELIDQLHDGGQTIILVTHDARLAARYAGRVVSLVDGRIADDATLSASASGGIAELVQVRSQVSPT